MASKLEVLVAYGLYRGYELVCRALFKVEALVRLSRMKLRGMRTWANSLLA